MEEIAVALHYAVEEQIPRIIAKGKGKLAKSILDKAKECNIPIYEDKDLAVVLASLEAGSCIPENLYNAVAVVLAYCYQINSDFRHKLNLK